MTDQHHFKGSKEPSKTPSREQELFPNSFSPSQFQLYLDLQASYLKSKSNQNIKNMIKGSIFLLSGLSKENHLKIQNHLEDFVKELLISELELAAFSLLIEKSEHFAREIHPSEFIKLCLFLSKIRLETNKEVLKIIGEFLKTQFINFEKNLNSLSREISISPTELSKRFFQLSCSGEKGVISTLQVDDIFRISGCCEFSEKFRSDFKENIDREKFYEGIKSKKDFCGNDEDEGRKERLLLNGYLFDLPLDENEMYLQANSADKMKPGNNPFGFLDEMRIEFESEDFDEID